MYTYGHGGPIGGVGYLEEVIADALATPAFATVQLEVTSEGGDNYRQLTIHVTGESLLPLPEGHDDRLFVYLTEDSIFTENQAGAAGNYYHRHSLRQSLSDTWGDPRRAGRGLREDLHRGGAPGMEHEADGSGGIRGQLQRRPTTMTAKCTTPPSQELHSFVPTGISTTEQTTPGVTFDGAVAALARRLPQPAGVSRRGGVLAALGTGRHTHRLACRPCPPVSTSSWPKDPTEWRTGKIIL